MGFITWDNSFAVNDELLDGQHKILFQIINRFHDAVQRQEKTPVLTKLFDEVLDYTSMHFSIEEQVMKQAAYPELTTHQEIHGRLLADARDLQAKIRGGNAQAAGDAMNFLKNWLEKHIKGTDTKYSPFLSKRNVA